MLYSWIVVGLWYLAVGTDLGEEVTEAAGVWSH